MRLSDYVYCSCVVIKNKVKHDTIFTQLLKSNSSEITKCYLLLHFEISPEEKCMREGLQSEWKKNVYVYICTYMKSSNSNGKNKIHICKYS